MPFVPIRTQRPQTRSLRGHATFTIRSPMRSTSHCDDIAPRSSLRPSAFGPSHLYALVAAQVASFTTKSPRASAAPKSVIEITRAPETYPCTAQAAAMAVLEGARRCSAEPYFIKSTNIVDGMHPDSIPPGCCLPDRPISPRQARGRRRNCRFPAAASSLKLIPLNPQVWEPTSGNPRSGESNSATRVPTSPSEQRNP